MEPSGNKVHRVLCVCNNVLVVSLKLSQSNLISPPVASAGCTKGHKLRLIDF